MAGEKKAAEQPADDKVTVIMRESLWGHKLGQQRRVSPEEAEFLVKNKHARWPASKR